jgi:YVTN family beta-propeller protein
MSKLRRSGLWVLAFVMVLAVPATLTLHGAALGKADTPREPVFSTGVRYAETSTGGTVGANPNPPPFTGPQSYVNSTIVLTNGTVQPGNFQAVDPVDPTSLALDATVGQIYIGDFGSNSLTLVNLTTSTSEATTALSGSPLAITVDPASDRAFVAGLDPTSSPGPGQVITVDGSTGSVLESVQVDSPTAIAFDPDDGYVYAADSGGGPNIVTVLNGTSGKLVDTIASPSPMNGSAEWSAAAVNPGLDAVYFADQTNGSVLTINASSDTIEGWAPVGPSPAALAFDARTDLLFVANAGLKQLTVVNGSTGRTLGQIPISTYPSALAVDNSTGEVYVASGNSSRIIVVDEASHRAVKNLSADYGPSALVGDPGTNELFGLLSSSNLLEVVNTSSGNVTHRLSLYLEPYAAAFDWGNGEAYVTIFNFATVLAVDPGTGSVLATFAVGTEPSGIAYDPANGEVYVACTGSGNVSVLDGTDNVAVDSISVGLGPIGIAFDPSNGLLYVANDESNDVSIIDESNDSVVATVAVGLEPHGVAFDPDLGEVFVANYLSNNVTVISGSAVIGGFAAGEGPADLAYGGSDHFLYVADDESSVVSAFNPSTGAMQGSYAIPGVGAIATDGGNGEAYVVCESQNSLVELNGIRPIAPGPNRTAVGDGPSGVVYDPASGSLYVSDLFAGTLSVVSDGLTRYPLVFESHGLPPGQNWSVDLAGTLERSTAPTHNFSEAAGTYPFEIAPVPGYLALPAAGNAVIDTTEVTEGIQFVRTYPVVVKESGLPGGTFWWVEGAGPGPPNATSSTLTISEPNGSYTFMAEAGPGFVVHPANLSVSVDGAGQNVSVVFEVRLYEVHFVREGPGGPPNWTVTMDGVRNSSSGATIGFLVPGEMQYSFLITWPTGCYGGLAPSTGTVHVPDASVNQTVEVGPGPACGPGASPRYSLVFQELGLPTGTPWSLSIGGSRLSAETDQLTVGAVNGTVVFSVTPVAGYHAEPANGSVAVHGGPATELIRFQAVVHPTVLGLPPIEGYSVLAGLSATIAAAAAVAIVQWKRRAQAGPGPEREDA